MLVINAARRRCSQHTSAEPGECLECGPARRTQFGKRLSSRTAQGDAVCALGERRHRESFQEFLAERTGRQYATAVYVAPGSGVRFAEMPGEATFGGRSREGELLRGRWCVRQNVNLTDRLRAATDHYPGRIPIADAGDGSTQRALVLSASSSDYLTELASEVPTCAVALAVLLDGTPVVERNASAKGEFTP